MTPNFASLQGILSEILEFVMGTGLIPADGEVWKVRRRAVVPALHKKVSPWQRHLEAVSKSSQLDMNRNDENVTH